MGEDLKLFGEVGLGYNQLQKDAEHINKLLNDIDKNAKLLGESFNKHKLDPNTAKTAKELEGMYQEVIKLSGGNNIAEQSTKELAKSINELAKKLKISEDAIAQSLKSMSSFDLNTKDFEKQAKDVKKFVDIQRQELTKWAKEKSSLAKELSLRDISQMVNDDYRSANKSGSATEKAEAINRVKQAMSVLNFTMEQNKAKVKDLQVEYDKLKTKANALTGETKKIANAQASSVSKQITEITRETSKLETQAKKFDKILNFSGAEQSVKSTTKSLGMLVGQAYAIKRAFGYINKEVMEFERNAVEIQRIAGYTKKEMDDLAQSTFEMGKNMGLNVHTIQEIEGLWARAGRSGQALVDATKTTALGFNVAEFKDAESAVASLNAIINQMYKGDATKAPEILDALTKVADKTAVRNVNDLVEVVSRAGANAKSLGMNLHELNAASSVVMERMKLTGDVLGTQFKTIFAYMADGKRIDKLKKYGVEFTNIGKDGTESLKPFMEMMDSLVAKYRELQKQGKDVMANDMIKNLSGVRNVATLKNLVEGWDSMRERVLLSQNSKGFAERQNAKMMETYAKKVEQLKVSFQELAVAIGNNGLLDAFKHIADGTRTGVEFLSKYNKEIMTLIKTVGTFYITMKAFEGLKGIFGVNGLAGMFGMLTNSKASGWTKAGAILSKLSGTEAFMSKEKQQQMFFEGFEKMGASAGGAVSPIKMLTGAMGSLKGQVIATVGSMSMAVPIIGALTLAVGGLYTAIYVRRQKRLQLLEDFTSGKADEAIGNIRELKKELDDITNTEAYRKGDADAMDAYKSTTEELSRVLGIANSVTIGNKDSMDLYNKSLSVAVDLKEREYELNKKIASSEARDSIERMSQTGLAGVDGRVDASEMTKAVARYKISLEEVKQLQEEIASGEGNPEKLRKRLDKALKNSDEDTLALTQRIQKLKEYQAQAGMTNEEVAKLFDGQTYDNIPIADIIDEFISKAPEFQDGTDKVVEGANDVQDAIEQLRQTINDLVKDFDDITKQTDTIDSALKELYENGHIDNGTVMKLIDIDPEMVKYIYKTKDGYGLLETALDHYNEKQKEANEITDEALNRLREKSEMSTDIDGNPLAHAMQSPELQQSLDDMVGQIQESVDKANVAFEDGKTGVDEFFGKLKDAKDDADLSNLLSGIDTSQIEALNGTLANDLQTTLTNLRGEFDSGVINIEQYAGAMSDAQGEALKLYTEINNLHQNDDGAWVNQAGQVDQFANALQNSVTHIDGAKDAYGRLMDAFEKTPDMALIFADDAFDIPRDQLNTFAEDFTSIMQDTKDNNKETWDAIVKDIMEQTGMSKEETEKCLTDTNEFVKLQDTVVKSAVKVSFGHLAKALNLTEAQIAKTARGIKAKLSALADYALSKMSAINVAMGGSALKQPKDHFKEIPRTPIGDALSATNTINSVLNGGKTKVATPSGRLVEKQVTVSDIYATNLEDYAKQTAQLKTLNAQADKLEKNLDTELNKSSGVLDANSEKLKKWYADNEPNNKKTRRGGGGGHGGSKSTPDVPKVVEDKLEDLRHELEMGRISEDQFYKGVEKLYKNGSGKMSKRGKQKFEKMLKDAKTKADSSIPPYAKVLIDDLEDQLKYGEIDQYTYSSKLDDIARRYKNKLGKKAIKDIEKKISEAKVGGLDKYFKSQIDEFESIIKVSDLAVKKIQAEQSLYQALNMGDTSGMSLQGAKINIINNKLFATEALAKKYESVLKVINEEVKKLDKNSSSYKNTLHGLATKQEEFTNKLNETRVAIIDLQKQRVEEQMKVYDAMQKKYDDAVSSMEQIESKLVTFIQQRNQKIREQIDKNHKAKMDALDKETKARDKELEKEKKRLQDALEAYRKYTQGKIDSLDKEAEEEDYNKELKKKMDERDELQYRINSLSLDDTSTARGKRIELTKQLADKNNEIEEFQKDRARKLTKEGLQDQLKDYEESLEKKQKKLDDNSKHEQELMDDKRKALEEEHQRELALLDEKMKASFVYAEAKQAILSGYVQDATGASVAIRDAMIQGMEEQGQASGILREKYINDLDAVIRKAHEAQQIMGMMNSSASAGSLQARLGLTDEGYQEYLGSKANQLGFSVQDTERYIQNKLGWSGASASERKRLANENHQLRAKYAGDPKNWNNKNVNIDKNGEVLGMDWILDTGSAMKVGQSFGQHTPLGGNFGRDEARNTAMADLGLYNSRTRGSSEAFFTNQMNQFKRMGMSYSQPNLSTWTSGNYYDNWEKHSDILNRFERTPSDISDYAGALGYIRSYKEDLQNNFNNDQTGMGFPSDSGDNSTREALMSAAKAQDGLPYSQGSERYTTHRDCSSYVYYAVKNSGLYGGEGFYTGDMIPKLAQYGWQDLGHIPKEQIKRGDILWIRDGKHNHTEIATQDGTLNSTGAHSARKPAGPSVWSYDYRILRHPKINGYSQGGIADYTGVAMLHGTKSSPEYIFNAPQFDALGRMIANYISAPAVYGQGVYNGTTSSLPEINIDTLINIEGNADQNTVREIERQSDEILDKLIIGLKKRGVRR